MEYSFALVPFPDPSLPEIAITGWVTRKHNVLTVHYLLSGKVDEIVFPEPEIRHERRNELWLTTCFEFFVAIPGQARYWEFNFSPSGAWNAFRMDAYRRIGFRQEELIQTPFLEIDNGAECLCLDTSVDLGPIVENGKKILVGITSVIQTRDGHESYWSLAHPGSEADFHLRESFTLALEDRDRP